MFHCVIDERAQMLADRDVIVIVEIRQRDTHRPRRSAKSAAVEQHRSETFGQLNDDIEQYALLLYERHEVIAERTAPPSLEVELGVIAATTRVVVSRVPEPLEQLSEATMHDLLGKLLVVVVFVE